MKLAGWKYTTKRATARGPSVLFLFSMAWTRERQLVRPLAFFLFFFFFFFSFFFLYALGSRKLSANEQLFVGAQTVASLLQTTQIISDVYFITDHASSKKTKIV